MRATTAARPADGIASGSAIAASVRTAAGAGREWGQAEDRWRPIARWAGEADHGGGKRVVRCPGDHRAVPARLRPLLRGLGSAGNPRNDDRGRLAPGDRPVGRAGAAAGAVHRRGADDQVSILEYTN